MKNLTRFLFDILKWPFLSTWLKISSRRVPILPGQIWLVPDVGAVLIRMSDKRCVYYTALESKFYEENSEIILIADRIEFLVHSDRIIFGTPNKKVENDKKPNEDKKSTNENVLNIFDFKNNKSEDNEH